MWPGDQRSQQKEQTHGSSITADMDSSAIATVQDGR